MTNASTPLVPLPTPDPDPVQRTLEILAHPEVVNGRKFVFNHDRRHNRKVFQQMKNGGLWAVCVGPSAITLPVNDIWAIPIAKVALRLLRDSLTMVSVIEPKGTFK